jgi:hypothetical protein
MPLPHDFLLSRENPIANRDEMAGEETALRLLTLPDVKAARQKSAFLWKLAYGTDVAPEDWTTFESAMDDYAFNYVIKAAASDAQYPRFVRNFMPRHRWFGREMPGARMGGDNPDNCYRLAGIEHGVRYEVHGCVVGSSAESVTFTLVANYGTSVTVQTLGLSDIQRDAGGSFTLHIDAVDSGGRANHLRTAPGTKFLFVRDSMQDWASETPLALSIQRMDPPTADPLSDSAMAARAAHRMVEDVPLYYWFTRLFSGRARDTFELAPASGTLGGLVTQASAQGRVRVADDEAAVVTVDPAGAGYSGLVVHDWWFRTLEYWERTASLTAVASKAGADGRITYVISNTDPGMHNWIDACGRHELLLLHRWQSLPSKLLRNGPAVTPLRMVKLRDLDAAVPQDMASLDSSGRRRQLDARRAAFRRRITV